MIAANKVTTLDELVQRLAPGRKAGQTVALANELFVILHVGHLHYLQAASTQADTLVVAVNSDESARRLKGPERPVIPQAQRSELIAGFACVDHVVIFDVDTVGALPGAPMSGPVRTGSVRTLRRW